MATKFAGLVLEPAIKHGVTGLFADAKHRREHRAPIPTTSYTHRSSNPQGNSYGIFALNNSTTTEHKVIVEKVVIKDSSKKKRPVGNTIWEVIFSFIVDAILQALLGAAIAFVLQAIKEAIEMAWFEKDPGPVSQQSMSADVHATAPPPYHAHDNNDTEYKLTILASQHRNIDTDILLEVLLAHGGQVDAASAYLNAF